MSKSNNKKAEQLGMPLGTASGKLRKSIIFNLLVKTNQNVCFQCNKLIETEKELSIEHKVPYLDSEEPVKLFFDLDNIAFSHLSCNSAASRPNLKGFKAVHPSDSSYRQGCRCGDCKEIQKLKMRRLRLKKV